VKPYPIFLIGLEHRPCVVVGGGREAEYKVKGLLDCDAAVTVISPDLTEQLRGWAGEDRFIWIDRDYRPGDLRGAFLVISERAGVERNAQIWQEAEAEGALVNVMDDVEHCNFVAGSVVRQGHLTVSISTSGAAPALSVRLRERFEDEFGPEYATFLAWMHDLRPAMAARYPKFQERRERWYALVDSDILDLLRAGDEAAARRRVEELTEIDLIAEGC
jgi:siroheme synthase-like protein